jgi:glycosyltransferase involved in cell wall biosynthesis
VTIHDLVWLKYPETTSYFNLFVQKMWTSKSIEEADCIIANSRSTKEDLIETLGVPPEKIRIIYPSISARYRVGEKDEAARYISEKYRVPASYVAALGSVEPRKNFGILVEAMRLLKARKQLLCPLVIAGASGWKNSALHEQIRSAGLTEDEIRFLGYVPDSDLQRFYGGASLFLFPSLYEGFGLPPLEAMACGTAVIASNARCMPEVLGDAAVLLPPNDAAAFADAISNLLNDEAQREKLQAKGVARAQRFNWKDSARQLADVFHEARK